LPLLLLLLLLLPLPAAGWLVLPLLQFD